jgi:hypothetical protein
LLKEQEEIIKDIEFDFSNKRKEKRTAYLKNFDKEI